MNDLNQQISRKIKSEFALRGLTYAEIAAQLGCNRNWISQVVSGFQKNERVRRAIVEAIGKDPWAEHGL